MTSDEARIAGEVKSGLGFEHTDNCEADREQGRLRVRRQGEFSLRALEHEQGQILPERLVDLCQSCTGLRKRIGQRLTHTCCLRSLSWKNESSQFPIPYMILVACEWHSLEL